MNKIKRMFGIVWMILGPLAIYYLVQTALLEISKKPVIDTKIQWGVFVIIFIPIAFGLVIFGYFAFRGAYDHLPESSSEIEDD
jgi:predicted Na+-dependent transporter